MLEEKHNTNRRYPAQFDLAQNEQPFLLCALEMIWPSTSAQKEQPFQQPFINT
jgi:hypothetical protein